MTFSFGTWAIIFACLGIANSFFRDRASAFLCGTCATLAVVNIVFSIIIDGARP